MYPPWDSSVCRPTPGCRPGPVLAYALGLCAHTSGALPLSQAGSLESDVLTSGRISIPVGPPAILLLGVLYSLSTWAPWSALAGPPSSLYVFSLPPLPQGTPMLWLVMKSWGSSGGWQSTILPDIFYHYLAQPVLYLSIPASFISSTGFGVRRPSTQVG